MEQTGKQSKLLQVIHGMVSPIHAGVVLSLTELVGDYGAKIQNPVLTLFGYNLLALELLGFLKGGSLTLVNSNWDGISNVFTMVLGFLMGERFTDKQYLGLGLITMGLFLIQ